MVNLYVCKICGEPYIGGSQPEDCPFCGAPKNYLRPIEEFTKIWETETNEQEKKDLQETLNLEINATAYYQDVSENQKKYSKHNRLYKQLTRVEKEHAEIASKFLNVNLPEIKGEKTKGNIEEDLKRTKELETHAVQLYTKFLSNSQNPNVKNFFVALLHAEKEHESLVGEEL